MRNENEIFKINNKTIDKAFVSAVFIAILCMTSAFFRERLFHTGMTYYTYPTFLAFLLITIFRNRISRTKKIYFVLITIIFVLITSLLTHGLLSSLKVFIVGIPIVLSFLTTYKRALISMFVCLGIYVTFALLFSNEVLDYGFDLEGYVGNFFPWLYDACILFLASWVILIIGNNYSNSLIEKTKFIQRQNTELADKEEKFRILFEDASDAIMLLRPDGEIFDCNQTACLFFKYPKEEMLDKTFFQLSPEFQEGEKKSIEMGKKLFLLVINGQRQKCYWEHIDSERNSFFASIALNKIKLSEVTYIQATIRDISKQKKKDLELEMYRNHLESLVKEKTKDIKTVNQRLQTSIEELNEKSLMINKSNAELKATLQNLNETQAQLFQSEKLASLGTLTAGVAHEINNPLNYIKGAHYGLSEYFEQFGSNDKENTDVLLYSIETGINRATEIVRGLNQFSRSNDFDEKCNIHSILDNCLIVLHNQLKDNVSIVKEYTQTPVVITGNVGKLHQVFINILSNANYAIKENGKIKLTTSIDEKYYVIEIADNGAGIEDEVLTKIFDPFFTTKPQGEGTGIGLYVTFSIIQEHNGKIKFKSKINKGTRVIIKFPHNKNQNEK